MGTKMCIPQILSLSMAEKGEHFSELFHKIAAPPQPVEDHSWGLVVCLKWHNS